MYSNFQVLHMSHEEILNISTWQLQINFRYLHICHMQKSEILPTGRWRKISDFSSFVMYGNLKFLHMTDFLHMSNLQTLWQIWGMPWTAFCDWGKGSGHCSLTTIWVRFSVYDRTSIHLSLMPPLWVGITNPCLGPCALEREGHQSSFHQQWWPMSSRSSSSGSTSRGPLPPPFHQRHALV